MSIPGTVAEIDADALTSLVQRHAPGAVARSVTLVDAHSGTTGRARLQVDWERAALPSALFAKLPPTDPFQRAFVEQTGMGAREARFYRELAAEMPIRVPRPIASAWSDDGRAYLMIVEDLVEAGCTFPSFQSGGELETVQGAIDSLARLHAGFWESPRFDADLSWVEPPMASPVGPQLVSSGRDEFGTEQPPVFHEIATLYVDHNDALVALLEAGPTTLAHGDPHLGNQFVDGATVGFLDWAVLCRASGFRDVAYFLCASVETELRRTHQEALLRRYLDGLVAAGAPAPDFETGWRALRRFAITGWIAAVCTLAAGARMQSVKVGRRAVERANATLADLDSASLLREELGL